MVILKIFLALLIILNVCRGQTPDPNGTPEPDGGGTEAPVPINLPPVFNANQTVFNILQPNATFDRLVTITATDPEGDGVRYSLIQVSYTKPASDSITLTNVTFWSRDTGLRNDCSISILYQRPRNIFCIDHVTGEIFVTSQNTISLTSGSQYIAENDVVKFTIRATDKSTPPSFKDFVTEVKFQPLCLGNSALLQTFQQNCPTSSTAYTTNRGTPGDVISVGTFNIVPIVQINFSWLTEVPDPGEYKITLETTTGAVSQSYTVIRGSPTLVNVTMGQPATVNENPIVNVTLVDPNGNTMGISPGSITLYSVTSRSSCLDNKCVDSFLKWRSDVYQLKHWNEYCIHEETDLLRYQYDYCKDNQLPVIVPSLTKNVVIPAANGTEVGKLDVSDPENRPLKYSIRSIGGTGYEPTDTPGKTIITGSDDCLEAESYNKPRSFFCINFNTGMVMTTSQFTASIGQQFAVTINVVDGSVPPARQNQGAISIKVIDGCHPASEMYRSITVLQFNTCVRALRTAVPLASKVPVPYIDFSTRSISKLIEFEINSTLLDGIVPADTTQLLIRVERTIEPSNFGELSVSYKRKQDVVKQAFNLYIVSGDAVRLTIRAKSPAGVSADLVLLTNSVTLRGFFYTDTCNRNTQCVTSYKEWTEALQKLPANCNVDPFHLHGRFSDCLRRPVILQPPSKLIIANLTKGRLESLSLTCRYFSFGAIQKVDWLKDGEIATQFCLGDDGGSGEEFKRKKRATTVVLPRSSFAVCDMMLTNADQQGNYSCRISTQTGESATSEAGYLQMIDVSTTRMRQRFTTLAFHPEMNNQSSSQFQELNTLVRNSFAATIANTTLKDSTYELVIKKASKGSVIADYMVYFPKVSSADRLRIGEAMNSLSNVTNNNNNQQPSFEELKNLDICIETVTGREDVRGLYRWSTAISSDVDIVQQCKYGGGNITRKCLLSSTSQPQWSTPIDKDCRFKSQVTNDLFILSEAIVTADNVTEVAKDLLNLTDSASTTSTNEYDVEFVSNTLQNIKDTNVTSEEIVDLVLQTVNSLLTFDRKFVARAQKAFGSSTSVIRTLEIVSETININSSSSVSIDLPNIALSVLDVGSTSTYRSEGLTLTSPRSNNTNDNVTVTLLPGNNTVLSLASQSTIYLPPSLLSRVFSMDPNSTIRVTTFVFVNNNLFISADNLDSASNFTSQTPNATIDSRVMSASLPGHSIRNLVDPMQSYFRPTNSNASINPASCVFWDINAIGGLGTWSTEGCRMRQRQNDIYVCECDHLTSFAVLLDINNPGNAGDSPLVLEIITYIGCGISMASLVLTLLTFAIFPKLRKALPPRILMCLCVTILALLIVFVVGIDRTSPRVGCQIVGLLLHYLVLATFCWMAVEGYNLYRCFVKVVGSYMRKFLLKASIFAWGVPAVVVAVTAGVRWDDYGSESNCMLQGNTFYFAFLTPVAVILFMNFIVLFLVLFGIRKGSKLSKDKKTDAKSQLRIAFACSIILGLTWASAFFAVDDLRLTFQIIFCVLNSLQGFFIFLFYCVRNQDVRKEWRRVFGLKPEDSRASTTGSTGKKMKLTTSSADTKSTKLHKNSTNGGSQSSLLNRNGHSTDSPAGLRLTRVNGQSNGSTRISMDNSGNDSSYNVTQPSRNSNGHSYQDERF